MIAASASAVPVTISVVTPTLNRPDEVIALLDNLSRQTCLPFEVVLVDGAPDEMDETQARVLSLAPTLPYLVRYIRASGGTAIQRNVGIDAATGRFIAFIDDDMLFEPDFFQILVQTFMQPDADRVVAMAGYITNQHLNPATSPRWRWYRRLGLFSTYVPGQYDFNTGYPINRYLQPPHDTVRDIDFMGAGCALWRRDPFDAGLRFSRFFADYGVMEDAHLALSAKKRGWRIWEVGSARCVHMHSERSRASKRRIARKSAVNYRFLFVDIVPVRTIRQEWRFWRVQAVDLVRYIAAACKRPTRADWAAVVGKVEGMIAALRVRPGATSAP